MEPKMTPMHKVLADMGRAANEGRARRFAKRPIKGVEVAVGDLSMEPHKAGDMGAEDMGDKMNPPSPGAEMGHEGLTPAELEELMQGIQR